MFCNSCGKQIPDASTFCNKCGSPQVDAPSGPPPPRGFAPAPSHAPESDVWKGGWAARSILHWWLLWLGWAGALAALRQCVLLPWLPQQKLVPVSPQIADYVLLALAGVPFLWIVGKIVIRKLSLRYRLSTHRLFIEEGIISRRLNELELIRVDDVAVTQHFFQRLLNTGVVHLVSSDATHPKLRLQGIVDPVGVKEKIRGCVHKRRAKAVHLENL